MLFLVINSVFLRGKISCGEACGLLPEIFHICQTAVATVQML